MEYEPNPKHKEPWQRGRKGSLCPKEVWPIAQDLLNKSEMVGRKRFVLHGGRAYCAQQHAPDRWHGYPIGMEEVPPHLQHKWKKDAKDSAHKENGE